MPVEIKELVVRALVRSSESPAGDTPKETPSAALGDAERQALIAASVREVLRVLECSKER